jgi:hypothetical protein
MCPAKGSAKKTSAGTVGGGHRRESDVPHHLVVALGDQ